MSYSANACSRCATGRPGAVQTRFSRREASVDVVFASPSGSSASPSSPRRRRRGTPRRAPTRSRQRHGKAARHAVRRSFSARRQVRPRGGVVVSRGSTLARRLPARRWSSTSTARADDRRAGDAAARVRPRVARAVFDHRYAGNGGTQRQARLRRGAFADVRGLGPRPGRAGALPAGLRVVSAGAGTSCSRRPTARGTSPGHRRRPAVAAGELRHGLLAADPRPARGREREAATPLGHVEGTPLPGRVSHMPAATRRATTATCGAWSLPRTCAPLLLPPTAAPAGWTRPPARVSMAPCSPAAARSSQQSWCAAPSAGQQRPPRLLQGAGRGADAQPPPPRDGAGGTHMNMHIANKMSPWAPRQQLSTWTARPRSSPAARAGWPADGRGARRGRRAHHAHLAQGRDLEESLPTCRRAASTRRLYRRRLRAADEVTLRRRRPRWSARQHRHPRQQRRRDLGRASRGPSARRLGQGDEPEYPQRLPAEPGGRPAQHDPEARGRIINIASIAGLTGTRRDDRRWPTTPARAR